jgi:hypothetical protein
MPGRKTLQPAATINSESESDDSSESDSGKSFIVNQDLLDSEDDKRKPPLKPRGGPGAAVGHIIGNMWPKKN